jgi:hypothetical protein
MKLKTLVGAAAAAALIATPAMAKSQEKSAGMQQQRSVDQTGAKKMKMSQRTSQKTQARHAQLRESNASVQQRQGSGFAPLDFAAGVAGGAVNTAGAIAGGAVNAAGAVATAPFTPFRGDSYTYARDASTFPNRGYLADANGPRCLPGQITTINGNKMTCQ